MAEEEAGGEMSADQWWILFMTLMCLVLPFALVRKP